MEQDHYISINREVTRNSIYDDLKFYYGDYRFDGQEYSIWEFKEKENEQMFLFSHPDNELDDECAIYFTLPTEFSVFIDMFKCDIGPGIGRKMLEAFLNYLLDKSTNKYGKHKFTRNTKICLKPGKIVDSNRLSNEITFNKDNLIGYYNSLGFRMKADTSQLCETIDWLLYSIQKVHNKRTGSSISKYKKHNITNFALKVAQRFKTVTKSRTTNGSTLGGRKKQMTRKKRK
jgi:hypothetical protein